MQLFVSHSSKNDDTVKIRDAVVQRLDAHYELLHDANLRPGARWRSKLDDWLAECEGGVILYSEDAIESGWVYKESQILSWRHARNKDFVLVPVVFNPVTDDLTRLKDFRPMQLGEIQFLLAGGTPREIANDAGRLHDLLTRVHDAVAAQAPAAPETDVSAEVRDWVDLIVDVCRNAGLTATTLAAIATDVLQVEPDPKPGANDVEGWARLVARRLVCLAPDVEGVDAFAVRFDNLVTQLNRKLRGVSREQKEMLADLLFPVWVNPEAIRDVAAITGQDPPRTMCIVNASLGIVARNYVDRAELGLATVDGRIIEPPDISVGHEDSAIKDCIAAINDRMAIIGDDRTTWPAQVLQATQTQPWYVVLRGGAATPRVHDALLDAYRHLTFVVLPGAKRPGDLGLPGVHELTPELTAGRDGPIHRAYKTMVPGGRMG